MILDAVAQLRTAENVVAVFSPLDPGARNQISDDGQAAFAIVGVTGTVDERLARADDYTDLATGAATEDVRVMFTGRSPISNALVNVASEDLRNAETVGLPVALVILVLAFGSLVAAGLPLLAAISGIAITFGVLTIAAQFTGFNLLIENIVTMIGLAIGIDYVLFIVTRFREELAHGRPVDEAVGATMATAGKTVLFSGLTVLVSVSGLLIVSSPTFQQIAIGMMAVVPIMVLLALSQLPATLAVLGTRVNRLTLPFLRRGVESPDAAQGVWARWSRLVMRRPVIWTLATTAVLIIISLPVFRLSLGVTLDAGAAEGTPAGDGVTVLNERFSPGELSPMQIVYERRDGALSDEDLEVIHQLSLALTADPGVAQVTSITFALEQFAGDHSVATLDTAMGQPDAARSLGFLVNAGGDGDLALISVVPTAAPDSEAAYDLVERIRDGITGAVVAGNDSAVYVGGLSAEIVDVSDEVIDKFPLVLLFVLSLSFILLMMIFRSLLLPLKAILMNLLSVGAAYGLLVLVFQEGWGESIFDFESTGHIAVDLPLMTFAILFGLSMDYEVFLLSRVKERWEQRGNTEGAVAHGLEHTARTITSAAAIMVAVFTAFAFTSLLEVQQIGFALAVAILVDATLIRILLVPATMRLLGEWNWWLPTWLDRWLPRMPLSEGSVVTPGQPTVENPAATSH